MTRQEAINAALRDYRAVLGTIIKPETITGFVGSDNVDINTEGAVEVRVIETPENELTHDTGGFIDPFWNIEVVSDPNGLLSELHSVWMFGPEQEYTS